MFHILYMHLEKEGNNLKTECTGSSHKIAVTVPIWAPAEFSPMVSNCGVSSVCSYNFNMCTIVQENFTVPVLVSAVAFI